MGPEIIRSLERVLGVIIGGFTVYLGFRLFLALPDKTDSSGRVLLPGGVSIYLSRIGPGAFFALFGCILVGISFYQQVRVERDGKPSASYHGAVSTGPAASAGQRATRLSDARVTLASLNRHADPLLERLPASDRNDLRLALEHSKVALIESVWDDNWGSFSSFRDWVRDGQSPPLPDGVRPEALELLNQGRKTAPP